MQEHGFCYKETSAQSVNAKGQSKFEGFSGFAEEFFLPCGVRDQELIMR
jgi:hypothetical protein